MIQLLGSVLIIVSALLADASALVYGLRFHWWEHPTGRHLFSYMAVFGAALTLWAGLLIVRGQFSAAPESGPLPYARLSIFAAITWVLAWRFLIIIRARNPQRRERRTHKEVSDDPS